MTDAVLAGAKVLDLSASAGGSFLSQLLADFGADVVKLEPPGGDPLRARVDAFAAFNRGKSSIVLDLYADADRRRVVELAGDADVLIEGFAPGTMERAGLGCDALRERNPRLVYVSLTPYGTEGPLAGRPAHDLNVLARSGILDPSGELDGPPVQPVVALAELGGALAGALGVALALLERERSGRGQRVDASWLDTALALLGPLATRLARTGRVPERGTEPLRGGLTCYMAYPCRDGWVALAALDEDQWMALCQGLGREDLIPHHRDRSDGWAQGQLEHIFMRDTRAAWAEFGRLHQCCLEPVLRLDEALAQDQVAARGDTVSPPLKLSRTPALSGARGVPDVGGR